MKYIYIFYHLFLNLSARTSNFSFRSENKIIYKNYKLQIKNKNKPKKYENYSRSEKKTS